MNKTINIYKCENEGCEINHSFMQWGNLKDIQNCLCGVTATYVRPAEKKDFRTINPKSLTI